MHPLIKITPGFLQQLIAAEKNGNISIHLPEPGLRGLFWSDSIISSLFAVQLNSKLRIASAGIRKDIAVHLITEMLVARMRRRMIFGSKCTFKAKQKLGTDSSQF